VALEDLRIKNMTASARGTLEEPGRMVRQKAGLNRSILNQGWFGFETCLQARRTWGKPAPHPLLSHFVASRRSIIGRFREPAPLLPALHCTLVVIILV
jgi:hypothetical protein